jgi:hypothetical protein
MVSKNVKRKRRINRHVYAKIARTTLSKIDDRTNHWLVSTPVTDNLRGYYCHTEHQGLTKTVEEYARRIDRIWSFYYLEFNWLPFKPVVNGKLKHIPV